VKPNDPRCGSHSTAASSSNSTAPGSPPTAGCSPTASSLGLTTTAASALAEGRRGRNIRHRLLGLLRQAIYGRLAGYEDVNDAERLARDPAMRAIVGREGVDRPAASTSQMGRFETEWLAADANLTALADLSGAWIDRVHDRKPPDGIILDLDSSESPTYGVQEGSAWNGHFRCSCYHPLFLFNQFGDLERCLLRPGNVHGAEDWRAVLAPALARYRERGVDLYFRADAARRPKKDRQCAKPHRQGCGPRPTLAWRTASGEYRFMHENRNQGLAIPFALTQTF
jgi:hypothetical protein